MAQRKSERQTEIKMNGKNFKDKIEEMREAKEEIRRNRPDYSPTLKVDGDFAAEIKDIDAVSTVSDTDRKGLKEKVSGIDVATPERYSGSFSIESDLVRDIAIEAELRKPCEGCGNDRMYHDKQRRVFCPICEDL